MQELTDEGRRLVDDVAQRNGVSADAVLTLLRALAAGNGTQAQFSHPDLGGMGQWSRGGMIMVGDMFNSGLKYRVDALCNELSGLLAGSAIFAPVPSYSSQNQSQGGYGTSMFVTGSGGRWPAELGNPASAGSQNELHYAVFPGSRRLAIERGGQVTVYDTGDHMISGFSQAQGGDQSLTFTSQYGLVRVADLAVISSPGQSSGNANFSNTSPPESAPWSSAAAPAPETALPPPGVQSGGISEHDIFTKIERLADLKGKGILTDEEFRAKKAELLSRL